jgi:hypothetical protein
MLFGATPCCGLLCLTSKNATPVIVAEPLSFLNDPCGGRLSS